MTWPHEFNKLTHAGHLVATESVPRILLHQRLLQVCITRQGDAGEVATGRCFQAIFSLRSRESAGRLVNEEGCDALDQCRGAAGTNVRTCGGECVDCPGR